MGDIKRYTSRWLAFLTLAGVMSCTSLALCEDSNSPSVGKYFCYIGNSVGLQTNSQTGNRYTGKITYPENEKKFFATIEANKQLGEDWCFSSSALDDLRKLRRGETPDRTSKTFFLSDRVFFNACQARYILTISGGPIKRPAYFSERTNVFSDGTSQFWISNDLSYVWNVDNSGGDHYLNEGKCEKIS
jgi:hypothetical protein